MVRNILILEELRKIDEKIDFEFIVFKGAGLILNGVYEISQRQMSDVDVLIKKESYNRFVCLLKEMGYRSIENGENSFYKVITHNFPPVIVDLHFDFFGFSFEKVKYLKKSGYKNLRVLSDEYMFLFLAIHSILNHAYFDERTQNELRLLIERNKNEEFLKRLILEAKKYGYSYILGRILKKFGFEAKLSLTFREIISIPFVEVSLIKYFVLNEYFFSLIYKPYKIIDFLKKPGKFKNLFLRLVNKMD